MTLVYAGRSVFDFGYIRSTLDQWTLRNRMNESEYAYGTCKRTFTCRHESLLEWSINPPLYPPQSISILLVDWKQWSDSLLLHDGCRRILPDRRIQKGLRLLLLVYSSSFPSRAGTFVRHRRITKQVKSLFNSRINHLVEIEHGMLLKLVGTNAKNGVRSRKWSILLLQTCTPSWLDITAEGNLSELDMMVYSILRRNPIVLESTTKLALLISESRTRKIWARGGGRFL